MKKGEPLVIVDSANFYSEGSVLPDPIRFYSSNYLTEASGEIRKATSEQHFSVEEKSDHIVLSANKTKFLLSYLDNSSGILEERFDPKAWEQFLIENTPPSSSVFYDVYSEHQKLLNIPEATDASVKNIAYINREFKYNFYSQQYESVVGNPVFDVASLPSIYDFVGTDDNISNVDVQETKTLTFGGFVNAGSVIALQSAKSVNDQVLGYFKEYAAARLNPQARPVESLLAAERQDFVINKEKTSRVSAIGGNFVPFPFYGYCEFSNLSTNLADPIHEMAKIGILDQEFVEFSKGRLDTLSNFIVGDGGIDQQQLNNFNFRLFLESLLNPSAGPQNIAVPVRVNQFVEYIKTNLLVHKRKYSELAEKPAKNSVLYYKIEKRQASFDSPTIQQTFYILPTLEDIIKFFDTQIKYGVEYYYTLKAVTLVVGNRYRYLPYKYATPTEQQRDLNNGLFKLTVENLTDYRIIDAPIAKWNGATFESPYTKPEYAVTNTDSTLQFSLLQPSLQTDEKFNIIETADFNIFERIRKSQDNQDPETIRSVSSFGQTSNRLQVYRIYSYPISYLDFQKNLYKTISLDSGEKTFLDDIIPDKKYYYLFRYLNQHDIPSNTSKILEVQVKNYDGFMQLETKEIDLQAPRELVNYKDMRRYLLVRASSIQTYPNNIQESISSTSDVSMGVRGASVWGKDFVLKLTSKKTGRVIKLNFSLNLQK